MLTVILAACLQLTAHAQTQPRTWAVSTNAFSWVNLGTINAEGAVGIHDHFTLNAGFTANPWKMETATGVNLMNRQYGGYVGAKYWPWHTFSEWWIGAKAQYKNFEQAGLLTSNLIQGDALGAGISAGYSLMIGGHFNLDFGLGVWGGRLFRYRSYKGNTDKTKLVEDGPRNFFFLDNITVSLAYIF